MNQFSTLWEKVHPWDWVHRPSIWTGICLESSFKFARMRPSILLPKFTNLWSWLVFFICLFFNYHVALCSSLIPFRSHVNLITQIKPPPRSYILTSHSNHNAHLSISFFLTMISGLSQSSTTPLTLSISFPINLTTISPVLTLKENSYTYMSTSFPLLRIIYFCHAPSLLSILSVKLLKFSWSLDPTNLYSTILLLNLSV